MTPNETLDHYFSRLETMRRADGQERAQIAWEISGTSKSVAAAWRFVYSGEALPQFPAFGVLADDYERAGRYGDAIEVCNRAIAEGWADTGYAQKIARYQARMSAATPPVPKSRLTPCRACKKGVAFDAQICPHCGAPNPASRSGMTGCAKLALLAIGGVVALGVLGHLMTPPKPKLTPEQVKAQEEACRQSAQCTGRRFKGAAEAPCAHAVEALAKFDYRWTNGFGERKFTRYDWANKEAGLLLFHGDSIQFQNGFGAFQRHEYDCVYDPENKRVVTVEARPWSL